MLHTYTHTRANIKAYHKRSPVRFVRRLLHLYVHTSLAPLHLFRERVPHTIHTFNPAAPSHALEGPPPPCGLKKKQTSRRRRLAGVGPSAARFGAIFESVDRFYYSADADALKGPDAFKVSYPPPRSDRRHVQMLDVPPRAKHVYVRWGLGFRVFGGTLRQHGFRFLGALFDALGSG